MFNVEIYEAFVLRCSRRIILNAFTFVSTDTRSGAYHTPANSGVRRRNAPTAKKENLRRKKERDARKQHGINSQEKYFRAFSSG